MQKPPYFRKAPKIKMALSPPTPKHSVFGTVKDIVSSSYHIKNQVRRRTYTHFNFWFVSKNQEYYLQALERFLMKIFDCKNWTSPRARGPTDPWPVRYICRPFQNIEHVEFLPHPLCQIFNIFFINPFFALFFKKKFKKISKIISTPFLLFLFFSREKFWNANIEIRKDCFRKYFSFKKGENG